MRYIIVTLSLLVFSCQSTEDHGHPHGEDGSHLHESDGKPAMDFTVWTEQTELFVEFPALVVGETSRFAAHFTLLDGHQPVREGSVTVSLIKGDKGIRHSVDAPSSPGIFGPSLQPKVAGGYRLVFELKTPTYSDRITLKDITVFATVEEAEVALAGEEENGNAITFLKEQAWKMEFQTAPVLKKEVFQTIPTSGVWKVAPSDYQTLVAPAAGRVSFGSGILTAGSPVKKGQELMTISSTGLTTNNLSAEIQKARADYEQVESEYERKKELFESKIVPKSEFEQVKQRYLVAKTNYETLSSGYSAGGKQLTAPMDGFIKSIQAVNGGFANQGDALVTVTSHKSSLLEVQVSAKYSAGLQNIQNIWYQPKQDTWSSLNEKGGKILSVGKEVEADQPLISVYAEVNEGVEMPEGSFTEAQLAIGNGGESLVVPISCLMEDYGNYSVIVQLSGESFERRNVSIGKRNGSEVEIIKGLSEGEVVVTNGAYQVKMASLSGQAPAHGHAH
ncbi:efflux RND transporter periplasmic adaptor subunit [Cyclobacterium plantarum]|uniref:Efflux RND transporter periplasmic adaptor subunit n=1 Tax=Cyclobacterium plantarum TaxID=2716263 RepID=A0ABX0H8E1_9BACT|nr:efflux RND transporter periplasmic adaptor subunit [Cyclobacterium plantarum]NHE56467.1 efflux RND transporter periplasmic adaptor subunit [Cyclobacterium plantarum]